MSETILSMQINDTHHPNVPKFCSLMNLTSESKNVNLLVVFFSYFDQINSKTAFKNNISTLCASGYGYLQLVFERC